MGVAIAAARAEPLVIENLRVAPLDASVGALYVELFAAGGSSCFCRYWHFEGTKNEWLDRCANFPEQNIAEQLDLVMKGDARARGLLAIAATPKGERAVGWMKLAPRAALPKLRKLPVYRSLDLGADEGVYAIGCFFVAPEARRSGVARALVDAASAHVRAWGGRAIEAYPRRSSESLHDEEAWMGPESLYVASGFTAIHDVAPYPVFRKELVSNERVV